MLQNLDQEMQKSGIEAIIVSGESTSNNPEFYYVTRTNIPRGGIYLKKVGQEPLLLVNSIDIPNAKKGIVKIVEPYTEYRFEEIMGKWPSDIARAIFYKKLLHANDITGKIAFYGHSEFNRLFNLVTRLQSYGYKLVAERTPTIFERIMATKSYHEIRQIEGVGRLVQEIVNEVKHLLKDCRVRHNILFSGGKKLTVGKMKTYVRTLMSQKNLMPTEGFIIACGNKSSNPHHEGSENDIIHRKEPIIIDLFPKNMQNIFFDFTRTVVLGKGKRELYDMHKAVAEAHDLAIDIAGDQVKASELMHRVCDHLLARGYNTVKSVYEGKSQRLTKGFIHSLGHGVGWTVGEKPFLTLTSRDVLCEGNVFTIEPGLYDKKLGGVRIEDVIAITSKGVKRLSTLEYSLEI